MPERSQKKDFFVSYNKADRNWAEWIAWQLEESGDYSVGIQQWDFRPGSNFVLEMDRAIRECERVIAVLSPDYLTSLFTQPEWAAYFAKDSTSEKRLIVPVRVRECELKGLLAPIVYIDLVGKDEAAANAALLEGVTIGRSKPVVAPEFPAHQPRLVARKARFPGTLPAVWNVPHNRNPNFIEPDGLLAELRKGLEADNATALTQSLTGLGGVGKTQLAVEYCYRYGSDYAMVWWIHSESPDTLSAEYAALAVELGLPEKDEKEQPLIVQAVRKDLGQRQEWLLIFDNSNTPDEIRGFLPQAGGHVLITSRNPSWRGVGQSLVVKKWSPKIAVDFLHRRTGQTDTESAQELALEVDYLPLALEQAGAYIEATATTLSAYVALFRRHRLDILKRGKAPGEHPEPVETTWEFAFQEIEKTSPGGAALINLCAFLYPDDIPRQIIIAGEEDLPMPLRAIVIDELSFEDAIGAIRRFSLIESSGGTLSIHRIVQAVVRSRLNQQSQRRFVEAATKIVGRAFSHDQDDLRSWKDCAQLLPHARSVVEFAENLGVSPNDVVRLWNQIGVYLMLRAEYQEAKAAFQHGLEISEKYLDPDDPATTTLVNNLGMVLKALGDLAGAKASFERALKIGERAHDTNATHLSNLASVLYELGDLAGAKAYIERALEISGKSLGPGDPTTATLVNNLGRVLGDMGDVDGAGEACVRALKLYLKAYGLDHPSVATTVSNIGSELRALGELHAAKRAYKLALTLSERAFGPDHPEVATDLINLGGVLYVLGDLAGAQAAAQRALAIRRKFLGEDHPKTQSVRGKLDLFSGSPEENRGP